MKAIILNDTGSQQHAGCMLTMRTIHEQCKRVGIDIIDSVPVGMKYLQKHFKWFETADLLIVNGEGSLHHDKAPELIQIAEHFPSVLINTVYQMNTEIPALHEFLYCAARESLSAKAMPRECDMVPDVCFASDIFKELPKTVPVFSRGVTDSCLLKKENDITINCEPLTYAVKLRAHAKIVTGRFHGAVFCAMLGIPFSCYPSNTHKLKGLVGDMGVKHHYQKRNNAIHECPDKVLSRVTKYTKNARGKVERMFNHIARLTP